MGLDPVRVRRFKRRLIPLTAVSMGVLSVGALVLAEVGSHQASAPPPRGASRRVGSPTPGVARHSPLPGAAPAPGPAAPGPTPAAPLPAVMHRERVSLPPAQVTRAHSDPALARLHAAETLEERMQEVDALIAGLAPAQAVPLLGRLLDSRLPGTVYEERALRLTLLARIGALPGPESEALLLAATAPNRPRPERLIGIEFLRGRSPRASEALHALVADDQDPVVQKKARWALARGQ
ncbi:MAG: hypothetical protein R3F62_11110 [Planctomycetota bacterium]